MNPELGRDPAYGLAGRTTRVPKTDAVAPGPGRPLPCVAVQGSGI